MMINQGVQFAAVETKVFHAHVLPSSRAEDGHVGFDAVRAQQHADKVLDAQRLVSLDVVYAARDMSVDRFFHYLRDIVDVEVLPDLFAGGERERLSVADSPQQIGYQSILILILILTVHRREYEMKERSILARGREIA